MNELWKKKQESCTLNHIVLWNHMVLWLSSTPWKVEASSTWKEVEGFAPPPNKEIMQVVQDSGLLPLTECSYETADNGLLFAFTERWHHETNTFHLAVEEMTITLDDVSSLLHIPIIGGFYSYLHTSKEVTIALLMELLLVNQEDTFLETKQCRRGNACLSWLQGIHANRCRDEQWDQTARAYLLDLVALNLVQKKLIASCGMPPMIYLASSHAQARPCVYLMIHNGRCQHQQT
ncbi:Protein MAIN-LIKE 2 [Glycine max]|nr:Protein MAIN-LIKE 2 [Glycine max]